MRECTFSETNNKREVFDEIDELVNALPKTYKRRAVDVANTQNASCSGLYQMSIEESMQASGPTAC